jgi:hypothetical protein
MPRSHALLSTPGIASHLPFFNVLSAIVQISVFFLVLSQIVLLSSKTLCMCNIHDLCSTHNIIMVIKSRRMKWAGHLPLDRDKWHTTVNAVMNSKVSQNVGNFLIS